MKSGCRGKSTKNGVVPRATPIHFNGSLPHKIMELMSLAGALLLGWVLQNLELHKAFLRLLLPGRVSMQELEERKWCYSIPVTVKEMYGCCCR